MVKAKIDCVIVCSRTPILYHQNKWLTKNPFYIGVEQGCLDLLIKIQKLNLAIGDFDHVTQNEWARIQKTANKIERHPRDKDDIDGFLAIKKAQDLGYHNILFIAEGGNWDFILVTLRQIQVTGLVFQNSQNLIWKLKPGSNQLLYDDHYSIVSFIALTEAVISISGLAYSVSNLSLKPFSSNAIRNYFRPEGRPGSISVHHGEVVVIYTTN